LFDASSHHPLPDLINFFLEKYTDATAMLAIRSLFYFGDAENGADPKCFFEVQSEYSKKNNYNSC
jgi:hypothetical protein